MGEVLALEQYATACRIRQSRGIGEWCRAPSVVSQEGSQLCGEGGIHANRVVGSRELVEGSCNYVGGIGFTAHSTRAVPVNLNGPSRKADRKHTVINIIGHLR